MMFCCSANVGVNFLLFSGIDEKWSNNFSEGEACTIKKTKPGSKSDFLFFFSTTIIMLPT